MRINQRRCQLQEYWRPDLAAPPLYKRDEEYFEHYREVFADSIRRASRSDEPIAIGFSGGHDSSAVFAMADKLDREGVLLAPSLAAFTCYFPGNADLDELEFAREVASHLGREIHISEPQLVDVKWLTDQAARYRDFPGYPFSGWAEAIYDSAGKQGSKVLLTGSFGDHCLAGSRSHYIEELAAGNFGNMVSAFRHDCGSYGALGASKLFLMSGVLPFAPEPLKALLRPLAGLGRRQAKQRGDHLSAELRTILANRKLDNAISPPRNPSDRPRRNLLRALSYPFDVWSLELGERIASANGFELRHPMNSRAFIEFAFQTPERLRSLGAAGKYIHIEALGDLLPMKLRRRETKADAASPVVDFIAPLRSHFVEALPLRRPSWVTQVGMEQLLSSFEGDGDNGWENWAILNALGCDLALP